MTEPTRKFTELSESPAQKIDITDGYAMARAILRSETKLMARNLLIETVQLPEPLHVLMIHDNAAPPLAMPRSGSPQEMVGSIMDQLEARQKGAGERRMVWGTQDGAPASGAMKIQGAAGDNELFGGQFMAVFRLREQIRTHVVPHLLGPDVIDIFSGRADGGNESRVKEIMQTRMADVMQDYQNDIDKATRGGKPKYGVEYLAPPEKTQQESRLDYTSSSIAQTADAFFSLLPAPQTAKPAAGNKLEGHKPAAHKPD